jgi:Dolichyl-phosphate-mannose-protein mannosyltransferase
MPRMNDRRRAVFSFEHPWAFFVLPALELAVQLAAIRRYGIFRDELYYVACARRLALGYVDHPPLSIVLLRAVVDVLGTSLWALRIVPALAGAATVLLVGLIARELGGKGFAQVLAMMAALAAPEYLATNHIYSMNSLDLLFWTLTALLFLRVFRSPTALSWVAIGLVLGMGLENKISILWLGAGLFAGMALSEQRRHLASRWPWIAAAIAFVLFLPHLLWQVSTGWPTLEFIRNASTEKMVARPVADFVVAQLEIMGPAGALVWLPGLGWLLFRSSSRPFRWLAWTYLFVFGLLALNGTSRAGYLAPAYGWLFAAGGAAWERLLRGVLLRSVAFAVVLASGIVFAPFGLPVLPVGQYVSYARAMGLAPTTEEKKELGDLPQFYADMHGWKEIVDAVAEAWAQVPVSSRERTVIFAPDYGVAGAVELLGAPMGLPRAVSGHNNYWLWGPGPGPVDTVIVVGGERSGLEKRFEEVELAATTDCGLCMPYENHRPIWICRGPRQSLRELWPALKHFD